MLQVENINVNIGDVVILQNISLKVQDGEFVFLLGPNGHGKTTLLKTISGLITPSEGRILFDGLEIHKFPAYKIVEQGVIHIPEGSQLFPDMTVLENLKLGAYTKNAWKQREENLSRVFKIFPKLEERKNQMAWTLSGGERRMVALGRGMMSGAKLLMIDEPSFGLAPTIVEEVYEKIKEVNEMGVSVLTVEQNIIFISELANRVYLLESGNIIFEGKAHELLESEDLKKAYLGVD